MPITRLRTEFALSCIAFLECTFRIKSRGVARKAVAPSRFPQALGRRKRQRVREPGHSPRGPHRGDPHPSCRPVPGWHPLGARVSRLPDARIDRKSTRLNSSHGYISYAVFCLKKKTKPLDTPRCTLSSATP